MNAKSFFTVLSSWSRSSHLLIRSPKQFILHKTSRQFCNRTQENEGDNMSCSLPLPRMIYSKLFNEKRGQWLENKHGLGHNQKLTILNENNTNTDILNTMAKIQNLDLNQIENWWKSIKESQEVYNQKYMPERTAALGADLAALHFFTYRQAAVRLKDSENWIAGSLQTRTLPHQYEPGYYVEAIDCSNFINSGIRYEGLENMTGLDSLKWLSLKNQRHINSWCLDRIAGQNGKSLEYLDISSCTLDLGCMLALTRMPRLETLIVKDPGRDVEIQASLSYLEYKLRSCVIKAVDDSNELVRVETKNV